MSTSRQIRLEALPILYKMTSFDLTFNERFYSIAALIRSRAKHQSRPTNLERVSAMNGWASRLRQERLKFLREISVQLPLLAVCDGPYEDMLDISLESIGGKLVLTVEKHAWLTSDSWKLLSEHAATTSKLAQSLNLEGEALIMFLTGRPDMWDQLKLASK